MSTDDCYVERMSDDDKIALVNAAGRLINSELYYSRLRRVLINGWDAKVLTDFLVLDDVALGIARPAMGTSGVWHIYTTWRLSVFEKAEKSARRKLDIGVQNQMESLLEYLQTKRTQGEKAAKVLEAIYGLPKKGQVYSS
ncbi:MAG TPA: hypothetical protein VI794_01010 [Patescibacteria group bacterium]|nr:hypothetical protein [Patescibacteria group bacterium]